MVQELDIENGEVIGHPIHDALEWNYTRFGHRVKSIGQGAFLMNEDGTIAQVKLECPRTDIKKSRKSLKEKLGYESDDIWKALRDHPDCRKVIKYETPCGSGARPFLPPVPPEVRLLIAQRYGVEVPMDGSFWEWVAEAGLDIFITEGYKKTLNLLSQGYIAIGLTGINGGYRATDALGHRISRQLIDELKIFVRSGRKITLAFDQDEASKTRQRVRTALGRFGGLLSAAGAMVRVAQWQPKQGKGIDDLYVESGPDAYHQALADAITFDEWCCWQALEKQLTRKANIRVNIPSLESISPESIPSSGIIALASSKGTGKTTLLGEMVSGDSTTLLAGHRIALMRNLCERLNVNYRGDIDRHQGRFISDSGYILRIGTCVDSLLTIKPEDFRGCNLVLDEVVQVIRHLLTSSTCAKDGKRPVLLARFTQLIRTAKRVIVADADLDNSVLHYIEQLRADGGTAFLVRNDYHLPGYPVRWIEAPEASQVTAELLKYINSGQKIFVATDSKTGSKRLNRIVQEVGRVGARVLLLNSETSGGEFERAFIQNPDQCLANWDVVIATPSMATGVSIETDYFNKVYGLFWGASSTDADMAQSLAIVRSTAPREGC